VCTTLQYLVKAACLCGCICNKYGNYCMDIWVLYRDHGYWIYVMMDLRLVAGVLVWRVLSHGGYWAMWRVILLRWPRSIVGWVH